MQFENIPNFYQKGIPFTAKVITICRAGFLENWAKKVGLLLHHLYALLGLMHTALRVYVGTQSLCCSTNNVCVP